jgi:hypothetical protein
VPYGSVLDITVKATLFPIKSFIFSLFKYCIDNYIIEYVKKKIYPHSMTVPDPSNPATHG